MGKLRFDVKSKADEFANFLTHKYTKIMGWDEAARIELPELGWVAHSKRRYRPGPDYSRVLGFEVTHGTDKQVFPTAMMFTLQPVAGGLLHVSAACIPPFDDFFERILFKIAFEYDDATVDIAMYLAPTELPYLDAGAARIAIIDAMEAREKGEARRPRAELIESEPELRDLRRRGPGRKPFRDYDDAHAMFVASGRTDKGYKEAFSSWCKFNNIEDPGKHERDNFRHAINRREGKE